MKGTMDDTVGFDDEMTIQDHFILGGIPAKEAIERLKGLGYDYNDAITMIDKWIGDNTNWQ